MQKMINHIFSTVDDLDAALEKLRSAIKTPMRNSIPSGISGRELIAMFCEFLESEQEEGLKSGFECLDDLIAPMHFPVGGLITIFGDTKNGKSAFTTALFANLMEPDRDWET